MMSSQIRRLLPYSGCIERAMASRSRKGIMPLSSALLRLHLAYCNWLWGGKCRKAVGLLDSQK